MRALGRHACPCVPLLKEGTHGHTWAHLDYGTRSLISEATMNAVGSAIEVREVDRLMVLGQSRPHASCLRSWGDKANLRRAKTCCELVIPKDSRHIGRVGGARHIARLMQRSKSSPATGLRIRFWAGSRVWREIRR